MAIASLAEDRAAGGADYTRGGDGLDLARAALSAGVADDASEDGEDADRYGFASPAADNMSDRQTDGRAVTLTDAEGFTLMTPEEFGAHATDLLAMLSDLTGLKSLAVPADLSERAPPAWGVVHSYLMKWAPSVLRPVDGWIGDAITVGMFVVPWGAAIRSEVSEKRAARLDRAVAPSAQGGPKSAVSPFAQGGPDPAENLAKVAGGAVPALGEDGAIWGAGA
jgi:hypothetical protein